MNLKDKMEKFNKRWGIISEDSYEEAFDKFKTRTLNIFKGIDGYVTKESISAFCQCYGVEEKWHTLPYSDYSWSENIWNALIEEDNEIKFYRLIELILSLDFQTNRRKILLKKINDAINFSEVNVDIALNENEIILHPKGEEELDEKLVNRVFSFLNNDSSNHFEQALKYYQINNSVKSAESLRRALEEFLRFKLGNSKGLNSNITELQLKLKKGGCDSQIRNTVFQIFSYLDQYFNEKSKHKDGKIDDVENEYLIYQVGLLLRYIERNLSK